MKLNASEKIALCYTCRAYTNWRRVYYPDLFCPCYRCKGCGIEYLIELDRKVVE